MREQMSSRSVVTTALGISLLSVSLALPGLAQDRLKAMPGYERYQKMRGEIGNSVKRGALSVRWTEGGKAFEYDKEGKSYRYDVAAKKATEISKTALILSTSPTDLSETTSLKSPGIQERGRQVASTVAPDRQHRAFYRDRNLWLSDADGGHEMAITTDGNEKMRIKYGIASWVYGEELAQRTAMWWSPDSKKIAFYRFDESKVPDYYLQMKNLQLQSAMDVEPYPKAGVPNPVADILVYDLDTKKTTTIDTRSGKPFDNDVVGHYAYHVGWSPEGNELLFNRTNRRQNIMEYTAADPSTGKCRVIVREEWPAAWTENVPFTQFLKDKKRFLMISERTGWKNYYLYDLNGTLIAPLTNLNAEVVRIVRLDEEGGKLYYIARDGDNPMKYQLHRVGLDGKGDTCLTDRKYHHTVDLAPDGKHFIDVAQTHDMPPFTRLVDENGTVVEELAKSDMSRFETLGLQKAENFTYKAADGTTDCYGTLSKPSNFDPNKKYPLLITIYSGPDTSSVRETFSMPNALAEYGFLVASFDSRGGDGRGRKFQDAVYLKLGMVEIDDQAAGVKYLRQRPYVDGGRVGIFGTSYGGYASLMCLLRYPDVYQAASASSPVTDWRMYDSIYTERYMWIPQENASGYDAGSAMTYARNLKGRLQLYFGTADNNVHPSNSLQLVTALQRAGKSFEVQVGPDQGHSGVRSDRMMEFFIDNLVVRPELLLAPP